MKLLLIRFGFSFDSDFIFLKFELQFFYSVGLVTFLLIILC